MVAESRGKRKRSPWTAEQIQQLQELWGTMRDAEVAAALGKTVAVVRFRATVLRLREIKGRRAGCRPGKLAYPWTREEDLVLIKNIGHMSIFEIMELLPRRNRVAIERRCYHLGYAPTQGTYTRNRIEQETGYDWRQIKRARDATGQVWKRYGLRKYMISFDQFYEIVEYLRTEKRKWSREYKLDKCISCGTSGTSERERHSGDGLCKKCVAGDTRIMVRGRGMSRIDEMVGKGEFDVWSGKEWRRTIAISSGIRPTVELRVSNGSVIRMTEDHSVLTRSGMVHAHSIGGRQLPLELPTSQCFPERASLPRRAKYSGRLGDRFPFEWSRDVGIFLGMVLGDGWISKSKYPTIGICAGRKDRDDLFPMQALVASWCDTKSNVIDYVEKTRKQYIPEVKIGTISLMTRIQWRCIALYQFVLDLGLDKYADCTERRAPSSIWSANADGVAGFICGMFSTDGCIRINNKDKIEITLSSVSMALLRDVQQLLFSFGIRSSIYSYPQVEDKNIVHGLSIFGINNIRNYIKYIGFCSDRKRKRSDKFLGIWNGRKGAAAMDLTAKIVHTGTVEPVYDLVNVGDERQFVANGISISNCWDKRRHYRTWIVRAMRAGRALPFLESYSRNLIISGFRKDKFVPVEGNKVTNA